MERPSGDGGGSVADEKMEEIAEGEAVRVWFARKANAPDAWRARAVAAAGLLSAAAAATLAALLFGVGTSPATPSPSLAVAAGAYVIAVSGYLLASVVKSPSQSNDITSFANEASRYFECEASRIRLIVRAASAAAIVAIAATAYATIEISYGRPTSEARLALDPETEEAIREFCPAFSADSFVGVRYDGGEVVVTVASEECGGDSARIRVDRSAVLATWED